ncbi:MAG: bacterioferritin-associated ferredoxin [Alphaproteobacteria bacterium]
MYLCLCNAISEREAEQAVASGARKLAQVYAAFGVRPQCGQCKHALKDLLGRCGTAEQPDHLSPTNTPIA